MADDLDFITSLRERSKNDREVIVGSEVRQLCDLAEIAARAFAPDVIRTSVDMALLRRLADIIGQRVGNTDRVIERAIEVVERGVEEITKLHIALDLITEATKPGAGTPHEVAHTLSTKARAGGQPSPIGASL